MSGLKMFELGAYVFAFVLIGAYQGWWPAISIGLVYIVVYNLIIRRSA